MADMDILLRDLGDGNNIGVELQEHDEETGEPLWVMRADVLLTTTELLALAQAIQDEHAASVSAEAVAEALRRMRASVAPRRYACATCGGVVERPVEVVRCRLDLRGLAALDADLRVFGHLVPPALHRQLLRSVHVQPIALMIVPCSPTCRSPLSTSTYLASQVGHA